MNQRRSKPRYLTSKRAHAELKHILEHHHELLHNLIERVIQMAGELERVQTEVTEISGTVDSAVALLNKLAQLIRDNAGNPAALNKIADDLDSKGNALAAAVVANDPDVPPPPPVEPVP